MKLLRITFLFSMVFHVSNLFGQTNRAELFKYIYPSMPVELQDNIAILVGFLDDKPPQHCPPAYINLLSNTNLFSPNEEKQIREVALKYKNVTTNSGPAGTKFKEWGTRQVKWNQQLSRVFPS
jgi:hypothetical protein